jgi:hypothetical protein
MLTVAPPMLVALRPVRNAVIAADTDAVKVGSQEYGFTASACTPNGK